MNKRFEKINKVSSIVNNSRSDVGNNVIFFTTHVFPLLFCLAGNLVIIPSTDRMTCVLRKCIQIRLQVDKELYPINSFTGKQSCLLTRETVEAVMIP